MGEIRLLPALPDKWARGYARGLKTMGNVEIDMKWKNGKVTYAKLMSPVGGTFKLFVNGYEKEIELEPQESLEITI